MSTKSLEVFSKAVEAQDKLEYFICGVFGALFAYLGQHYVPHKLEWNFTIFEPLSLLVLALGFYASMRRLHWASIAKNINHDQLDFGERSGSLTQSLVKAERGTVFVNTESGEFFSVEELEKRREQHIKNTARAEKALHKAQRRNVLWFHIRNTMLYLGFATIIASKVLPPYSAPTPATVITSQSPAPAKP